MLATISLYAMAASITDLFLFLLFLEQIDKLRIGRHAWCVMRFGRVREREREGDMAVRVVSTCPEL
jgi:hypothetical protein